MYYATYKHFAMTINQWKKMSGLSVAELTRAQPQTVLVTQCKVCHWATNNNN